MAPFSGFRLRPRRSKGSSELPPLIEEDENARPHAGSLAESSAQDFAREFPASRGRAVTGTGPPLNVPIPRIPPSRDAPPLDRRPSLSTTASYGHHRQTSIVHGIQHSRNASHVNTQKSPVSPQSLGLAHTGAAGPGLDTSIYEDGHEDMPSINGALIAASSSQPTFLSSPGTDLAGKANGHTATFRGHLERSGSGRLDRETSHSRSQSRAAAASAEAKTVGEFALYHLFTAFVSQANTKITLCAGSPQAPEPQVESICGPGQDAEFDQLIPALAHVARLKPKPLIDTLMLWRQDMSAEAGVAREALDKAMAKTHVAAGRRNIGQNMMYNGSTSTIDAGDGYRPSPNKITELQLDVIQAERCSTVSIYLLCRVFMEVIKQSTLAQLGDALFQKLLDIIFIQLVFQEPETLENSALKLANWKIFGELLGAMSNMHFKSVYERYIKELAETQRKIQNKTPEGDQAVGKAILLARSMKHLVLKTTPLAAWDMTCSFMQALAALFLDAHGSKLKYAYCQLLEDLFVPIASKALGELNNVKWKLVVDTLRPKLFEMVNKPKHWPQAFPVTIMLICVSPSETFSAHWLQYQPSIQARLKERVTRAIALRGLCRLVWRYLYHSLEPPNATVKRLDEITQSIFHTGKRNYLSTETAIAEPLIQLIRIIGYKHQDFAFKNLIFPLVNADLILSGREQKVEALDPEKMVIGIRGFLALMADLETGERPSFPATFYADTALAGFETTTMPLSPKPLIPAIVKSSAVKEDRLSRPVMMSSFGENTKMSYNKFCQVLGQITIICDNTFGGQAVLDEKFSGTAPKTPMVDAFTLMRRDEQIGNSDPRQVFYDLLHVAVQALPRCLSPHINFNSLINLLCTGTAHVQSNIAYSSAQSLKSIARQSHAQQVTIGFARFIFNFDDRYGTMSDGGMLGPGHIESTLRLYVELLNIWIEEIKEKTKRVAGSMQDDATNGTRAAALDMSQIVHHVDEIESHGLFFICSPTRKVRAIAITVLRLVSEFDVGLGIESTRVIKILEGDAQEVINVQDEMLTVAERSRLQRGIRDGSSRNILVELCSSEMPHDSKLWFKVFPNLIKIIMKICPMAVALTRESITARLSQMQRTVTNLADANRVAQHGYEAPGGRLITRTNGMAPESVLEQWKLCLIFACTTLSNSGSAAEGQGHARKSSRSSQKSVDKVGSAGKLFNMVLPFLTAGNQTIREAVVIGVGSVNQSLYRTLLEILQPMVGSCQSEARTRIAHHQRTPSAIRARRTDMLRNEITHIYKLTAHFIQEPENYSDESVLFNLVNFAKDLRLFLSDSEVQDEQEYHVLRTHYCGFVEQLYEGVHKTAEPLRWLPFQSRKATFTLMEDWCGFSPEQGSNRSREGSTSRPYLQREDVAVVAKSPRLEIEKNNLRLAALSAMAALCGGPINVVTEGKAVLQFDETRLLSWIDAIFEDVSDRTHAIGRRALKNLIIHNPEQESLLNQALDMCYVAKSPKSLESYFGTISEVLTERDSPAPQLYKIIPVCLFILGNENRVLRIKALRLLRKLEGDEKNACKLQDLDVSVSDKTIGVYKNAQFDVSQRMAQQYADIAPMVFSEFSRYFRSVLQDHQRNMVAAMLPWIQIIDLGRDQNGKLTIESYMLLVNLFEITVRCGTTLHNEIQALWQALATGPRVDNARVILDFIIQTCLEKKEQNFVHYARQIVVYLSATTAGSRVVEFLLSHIEPGAMVLVPREPFVLPANAAQMPYLANLESVLPVGSKGHGFSLGQLSIVLLVDLLVAPVQLTVPNITLLLQVVLVLWDNYAMLVQEQAREMLVHLIHELVLSKLDDTSETKNGTSKQQVEDFIDLVRGNDSEVTWSYDDHNVGDTSEAGLRVPKQMKLVTERVLKIFTSVYPGIQHDWTKVSLTWATNCSVRHLACRSFQIYRCIFATVEPDMLCDMLVRLSNTIAADEDEILTFSMEILTTLRTIIETLSPKELVQYPQLFWTTCACLNTTHEREFAEALCMLEIILDKLDLGSPVVLQCLTEAQPTWGGPFDGVSSLIYKGLRSNSSMEKSLHLLDKLVVLPSSTLVGDSRRLNFTLLANLPRFLHSFDIDHKDTGILSSADALAHAADGQGFAELAGVLAAFATTRFRHKDDFLVQAVMTLQKSFPPSVEYDSLVFLLGLLSNALPWYKIQTMQLLCIVIPGTNMDNPKIVSKGPDLISPLLRLLQTEYCPQALKVLDEVMSMRAMHMDRTQMRMSMLGVRSPPETRKQYEKTVSLYGIPHESGWSIPVPAAQSLTTRNNLHAVFAANASSNANELPEATPKIEMVSEEPQLSSYFPQYDSVQENEVEHSSHHSDLIAKLDSLDDFFDNDDDDFDAGSLPAHNATAYRPRGSNQLAEPPERSEDVYDHQAFPILNRTIGRNESISSFQNGFADVRVPGHREGFRAMGPAAFMASSAFNLPPTTNHRMTRPGMHTRSMTSPAVDQHTPPGFVSSSVVDLSPDPGHSTDETISDDEVTMTIPRLIRANTAGPAPTFGTMTGSKGGNGASAMTTSAAAQPEPPKQSGQTSSRFRNGIRRLTGGSTDAKDVQRLRDALKSPKVPKVPDMYLQGAQSGPKGGDH